jgi:regulator of protease activity HflC (stomatin/prohibitin superfamily)
MHSIYYFLNLQAALDDATEPWGIKVERVEM